MAMLFPLCFRVFVFDSIQHHPNSKSNIAMQLFFLSGNFPEDKSFLMFAQWPPMHKTVDILVTNNITWGNNFHCQAILTHYANGGDTLWMVT